MKVDITKTKSDIIYYLSKGVRKGSKVTTVRIERIGHHSELLKEYSNPLAYAKEYAKIKTLEEKQSRLAFNINIKDKKFSGDVLFNSSKTKNINIGNLFIQDIINSLDFKSFFKPLYENTQIEYNCEDILSLLTFSRILNPSSKKNDFDNSSYYYGQNEVKLHDIYRFLSLLSNNLDDFQTHIYKNSLDIVDRNTSVLYYDCTNFFFEIETDDDFRKYGKSKQHRPNPLVQMGLFMDGNGLPLAFTITPGNEAEIKTVKPLEEKIIKDFKLSKFIYCADAGLSSSEVRRFNTINDRSFIVTQSIKKMKQERIDWAISRDYWKCAKFKDMTFNIDKLDKLLPHLSEKEIDELIFYKDEWISDAIDIGLIKDNGRKDKSIFEQRILVTYSRKYAKYASNIRIKQLKRAYKMIESNINEIKNLNSPSRFIKKEKVTLEGKLATKTRLSINMNVIDEEIKHDGIYAYATTLEDNPMNIIKVIKQKWEIEECFRTMKTHFDARPIYLSREDRIKSHFATCFLSLLVYKILSMKLKNGYTIDEILKTLKNLNVLKISDAVYKTTYTDSFVLQELNKAFKTNFDKELLLNTELKIKK